MLPTEGTVRQVERPAPQCSIATAGVWSLLLSLLLLTACSPWTVVPLSDSAGAPADPKALVDRLWDSRIVPAVLDSAVDARVVLDAAAYQEVASQLDAVANIRRGLAQARKGVGRPADDVFDELERADAGR